jgi:hypothetical protein
MGFSFLWTCLNQYPNPVSIEITHQVAVAYVFLAGGLVVTMVVLSFNHYTFPRYYFLFLFAVYAGFSFVNIGVEFRWI